MSKARCVRGRRSRAVFCDRVRIRWLDAVAPNAGDLNDAGNSTDRRIGCGIVDGVINFILASGRDSSATSLLS